MNFITTFNLPPGVSLRDINQDDLDDRQTRMEEEDDRQMRIAREDEGRRPRSWKLRHATAAALLMLACIMPGRAIAVPATNETRLVDAIGKAENSKSHPYGIMTTYKTTMPRQACFNTIRHLLADWRAAGQPGDPIEFISKTYCPIGAKNDPRGLNVNWIKNVRWFYDHP